MSVANNIGLMPPTAAHLIIEKATMLTREENCDVAQHFGVHQPGTIVSGRKPCSVTSTAATLRAAHRMLTADQGGRNYCCSDGDHGDVAVHAREAPRPQALLPHWRCGIRYTGANRVRPRGVRTHVALIRTLRSYIEQHLLDLVDMNKFEPIIGDGADDYGRDDVVEAHITISGQRFQFHIEGTERTEDDTKPCGLLGVLHEPTGMTVKGSVDGATWERIEAFVRFATKPDDPER